MAMAEDHAHTHDHHHHHSVNLSDVTNKAFLAGIVLNVVFVLAEIVAGIIYGSMSLLTDAGHNVGDVASLLLSLFAFRLARKKPTSTHTYGYKKTTVLAALINAVILLVAVGILGYESIKRLIDPEPVAGGAIAWVAGVGIIVNGISAYLFYKNKEHDLNVKSAYLHLLADALVSVGVVIGGVLIAFTGWSWLDPMIGLIIMIVIVVGTWSLLRDSFRMAVDAVPSNISLNDITETIRKVKNVQEVGHVHIWSLSTTENALTAHVTVDENLSFDEKLAVVKKVKHELLHHNISHSTIELDVRKFDTSCNLQE